MVLYKTAGLFETLESHQVGTMDLPGFSFECHSFPCLAVAPKSDKYIVAGDFNNWHKQLQMLKAML